MFVHLCWSKVRGCVNVVKSVWFRFCASFESTEIHQQRQQHSLNTDRHLKNPFFGSGDLKTEISVNNSMKGVERAPTFLYTEIWEKVK